MDHDGARKRDALLLAAGKALRQSILILVDANELQHLIHALFHLIPGQLSNLQAVFNVLAHGQMRENRVALKHHADIALMGRKLVDDLIAKGNRARLNAVKTCDHAQQRRLAAAARAEQRKKLAVLDIGRQIRNDDIIAIFFAHMVDLYCNAHRSHPSFHGSGRVYIVLSESLPLHFSKKEAAGQLARSGCRTTASPKFMPYSIRSADYSAASTSASWNISIHSRLCSEATVSSSLMTLMEDMLCIASVSGTSLRMVRRNCVSFM